MISGAGDPARAAQAMASVRRHLVDREQRLVKLFTPPFEHTTHDPGYIRSYPPGLRENGGQYSHAAMWTIVAAARMGDGRGAVDLFGLLNPINHALTDRDAAHYRVEPYVVAADVSSVAPNDGRGGWTWYTGAAGWMYRAGVESILGLRRHGAAMHMKPCLPPDWPGVTITLRLGDSCHSIEVERAPAGQPPHATLDGERLAVRDGQIAWTVEPGAHSIRLSI
jgi:cyclic beta-1,2-glucan synthetase